MRPRTEARLSAQPQARCRVPILAIGMAGRFREDGGRGRCVQQHRASFAIRIGEAAHVSAMGELATWTQARRIRSQ
jgi:hypothetical protein